MCLQEIIFHIKSILLQNLHESGIHYYKMFFCHFLVLRYMVATGSPSSSRQKTEIVDLTDPSKSCVLDDIPSRHASTGGVLGTIPVICGGYEDGNLNECLLYGTSQVITMNSKRQVASSVAINPNKIWILGGYDGNGGNGANGRLDTTEFVTIDGGSENGPTLPEAVSSSCAVKFPDTGDVYSIGGYTYAGTSKNVWVANPSNAYTFSQGPSLMTARRHHACGTMSIGAKSIIVAAGGYNYNPYYLSSVEILDPVSNQWVAGK